MSFDLEGTLIVKEDTAQVSAAFKKREFVIEVANERNAEWNDFIKFQLTQDRCDTIEGFALGDKLKVTFNIKGRKWEKDGKVSYFSNLEAWRVDKVSGNTDATGGGVPMPDMGEIPPPDEADDLPF